VPDLTAVANYAVGAETIGDRALQLELRRRFATLYRAFARTVVANVGLRTSTPGQPHKRTRTGCLTGGLLRVAGWFATRRLAQLAARNRS
jgi:hypothetical protein